MAATRIGIPLPRQTNTRPSGRYKVQAPDAPNGSVLRVTMRDGSVCFVEVACPHEKRIFVDANRELIDLCGLDWDYATRSEVSAFRSRQLIESYADVVDRYGAPTFVSSMRGLPAIEREGLIAVVSDVLKERGRNGKADQLRMFLERK